jgi:hypothetical protein
VVDAFNAGGSVPASGVLIDQPGQNVVLVLAAARPTDWKFSLTPGSSLVGVWLISRQISTLAELPESTPVLDATEEAHDCATAGSATGTNPDGRRILEVLNRSPVQEIHSTESWVYIRASAADRSVTLHAPALDSRATAAATETALQALINRGAVRRMTREEVSRLESRGALEQPVRLIPDAFSSDRQPGKPLPYRVFMVQLACEFPPGLTGSHMATFIVPPGVPRPSGDPGHSQIVAFVR